MRFDQFHLDSIADVLWWIKGNCAAHGDAFDGSHIKALEEAMRFIRENRTEGA